MCSFAGFILLSFWVLSLALAVTMALVLSRRSTCRKRRKLPNFPRCWDLFQFFLSPRTRRRIFDPAHNDLKADFLAAAARVRGQWSRRWLILCFVYRTLILIVDCVRVSGVDRLIGLICWALPQKWVQQFRAEASSRLE